jgi:homoserine dehydrogenase
MSGLISKYLHLLHISFVTGILIGHSAVIWGALFLLEELNKLIQLVIKIQHVLNGTIQSILSELKQSRSCIHEGSTVL